MLIFVACLSVRRFPAQQLFLDQWLRMCIASSQELDCHPASLKVHQHLSSGPVMNLGHRCLRLCDFSRICRQVLLKRIILTIGSSAIECCSMVKAAIGFLLMRLNNEEYYGATRSRLLLSDKRWQPCPLRSSSCRQCKEESQVKFLTPFTTHRARHKKQQSDGCKSSARSVMEHAFLGGSLFGIPLPHQRQAILRLRGTTSC